MFLLLSADPTLARQSVLRNAFAGWAAHATPLSTAEILSWAADGFIAGREYWERGRLPRCPYGDVTNSSYMVAPLRLAWKAWLEGFMRGLEVNPRKPKLQMSPWGKYKVIEYV